MNAPFSGIRLSCSATETLVTGFIEKILKNFEQASYATLSNASSSQVNRITKKITLKLVKWQ